MTNGAAGNFKLTGHDLRGWVESGWLTADALAEHPSDIDLARAHLILDLKQEFGVNDEGIGIILHLIDQMHGLRRTLHDVLSVANNNGPDRI